MAKAPEGPQETSAERAAADVGAQQYQMSQRLQPIKNDTFKRLMDWRNERARFEGQANADRQQRLGAIPTPGPTSAAGVSGRAVQGGMALARGTTDTAAAATRAGVDTKLALAGIAQGDQNRAIQGIDELAQVESSKEIESARRAAAQQAARTALAMQAIGAAGNLGKGALTGGETMSATGTRTVTPAARSSFQTYGLGSNWDAPTVQPIPLG